MKIHSPTGCRPQKKTKKKQKQKKNDLGRPPPFQTRGSPQVSSHLHHLPGWGSQICKVPPKPSQSSCAQAPCHDPRHTLFICKLQKWDDILSESDSTCFLLCFFQLFFFVFFLLFYCFFIVFFCFFLFFFAFLIVFLFFSKWLNRFFCFLKKKCALQN